MLFVALAFVLLPLLRSRRGELAEISDAASNVAIFRAYKRELDEELARGAITAEERDAAVADLGTRVIAEVPLGIPAEAPKSTSASSVAAVKPQRPWLLAGALSLAIVVAAASLYAALGAPAGLQMHAGATATAIPAAGVEAPMSDKQILAMVDSLARKMEENPDDPRGWVLLARSQNALGRFPEAAQAFERAIKLVPGDAQLLADYADATVMMQQGRFEGKPQALINQALKADPNNMKALALAGTAEIRRGNREAALKRWEKLKTIVAKDSDDYREIENIIADVKSGKAMRDAAAAAAVPTAMSPRRVTEAMGQAPEPGIGSNPAPRPALAAAGRITGRVMLDPALAANVAPGDTLFVFARAVNGPKMPLAVLRMPVPKQWPLSFELTDAMAMAPGMNLSSFPQVTIDARISKAGNAQPQPGDLSGQSAPVTPRAADVAVTISRVLP